MLPAYIIEDILKRERDKHASEELLIERPELDESWIRRPIEPSEEPVEDSVAIIDFTV